MGHLPTKTEKADTAKPEADATTAMQATEKPVCPPEEDSIVSGHPPGPQKPRRIQNGMKRPEQSYQHHDENQEMCATKHRKRL